MGLAEVVPGVSGGTVALITGIYQELIDTIARFGPESLSLLSSPREFYAHHNFRFLLALGVGMGIGILAFAQVMRYLLDAYPTVVWAFFFGVIVVSAFVVARHRDRRVLMTLGLVGLIAGLALALLPVRSTDAGLLELFVGGSIAVCAWILPAVSGSYVLVLMGLYEPVISALSEFAMVPLMTLASGCAVGLFVFVRVLKRLLIRYYEQTMGVLAGFMLGSTINLWPWRHVMAGESRWLSPWAYEQMVEPSMLTMSMISFVIGGSGLWLLARNTDI
ncbi:MAG: DUF368 domain-containing protein [Pseudomonadota bacterium]|nr:DUF368 domain-containing protein [Pseudomonadota bacterium]